MLRRKEAGGVLSLKGTRSPDHDMLMMASYSNPPLALLAGASLVPGTENTELNKKGQP